MIQGFLDAVAGDDGQRARVFVRLNKPFHVGAERGIDGRRLVDDEGGRSFPERLHGEEARLGAIRELETPSGMGESRGRVIIQLDLTHRDQFLSFGPAFLVHALAPEDGDGRCDDSSGDHDSGYRKSASPPTPSGVGGHRGCEVLLGLRKTARIAVSPQ